MNWKLGLCLLVLAACIAAAVLFLHPGPKGPAPNGASVPEKSTVPQPSVSGPPAGLPQGTNQLDGRLHRALSDLGNGMASGKARQGLAELKQALAASGTNAASAAIRRFLDSKDDGTTGIQFKVGAHGALDGAPTLRTFLLDYLGQTDPAAAAACAREVLATSQSADEWAVALRNLAAGDSSADGRALLEQKTSELLQRQDWQQDPSVGYLEAFDAAVYLGGTNLVPVLGGLVQKKDNQAVAHAAFLALDRLVLAEPAQILQALETDPNTMQGREMTRADYFARADVRDPQQRQVLENYLLNPRIGPGEIAQFAGIFPNANYMISANLLTPAPTPDPAGLRARDAESLSAVQQWLTDPRFATIRPQLERIQNRLLEFARQAAAK
ncbi:MAG: hypothetical protein C5B50_22705 [Verrucomicrobia bacterium]|nr:MAG: hypothetical protein C5B50_22705 [Verrucomicrobiota bacterium]